jgi:hypothetical protein
MGIVQKPILRSYYSKSVLRNQFVTAETKKTAATVVKLIENLLSHGDTVWMKNSYNSPQLAWSMKSKKKVMLETLCANRKNALPVVKNVKLKTGEHCGQYSGDAVVLV